MSASLPLTEVTLLSPKLIKGQPATTPGTLTAPRQYNEDLHEAFTAYRKANESSLSLATLGNAIGTDGTVISKYLSRKYTGDIAKVEGLIEAYLSRQNMEAQFSEALPLEPFATEPTRMLHRHLDLIALDPQIGAAVGPAGVGKTSGIALYLKSHPNALLFTAGPWSGSGAAALRSALWRQLGLRKSRKAGSVRFTQGERVVQELRSSRRLIIIDEAHELTSKGRAALRALHNETQCPIALIGNPVLLDQWSVDDQNQSRIGFKGTVALFKSTKDGVIKETKAVREAAEGIVSRALPNAPAELLPLAYFVAARRGHLRQVYIQCRLTARLMEADKEHGNEMATRAAEHGRSLHEHAFRVAHECLVRGYDLPK